MTPDDTIWALASDGTSMAHAYRPHPHEAGWYMRLCRWRDQRTRQELSPRGDLPHCKRCARRWLELEDRRARWACQESGVRS